MDGPHAARKTEAEVEALKALWREDPRWDLETTKGFEAHRVELRAFRLGVEAYREAARAAELRAVAVRLGEPFNLTLAAAWLAMEERVARLAAALERAGIEVD
jgi:hypothetical protein